MLNKNQYLYQYIINNISYNKSNVYISWCETVWSKELGQLPWIQVLAYTLSDARNAHTASTQNSYSFCQTTIDIAHIQRQTCDIHNARIQQSHTQRQTIACKKQSAIAGYIHNARLQLATYTSLDFSLSSTQRQTIACHIKTLDESLSHTQRYTIPCHIQNARLQLVTYTTLDSSL